MFIIIIRSEATQLKVLYELNINPTSELRTINITPDMTKNLLIVLCPMIYQVLTGGGGGGVNWFELKN